VVFIRVLKSHKYLIPESKYCSKSR
jgi:hypothetical protein